VTDESPARRAWRVTEPLHAMIYFVPEAPERYAALGIDPAAGYFASRGAVFGALGAGPVIATFYNFNPDLVRRALPAAWEAAAPAAVLSARMDAADAALRRGLGDLVESAEVAEAAALARRAAESAAGFAPGRPLYAAHAELPWPAAPHLQLFHAQTLLREFRGDGHVAALMLAGVSGLEAILLHVAAGEADERFLRVTRGWSREQWAAGLDGLRRRGLVEPGGDTPALTGAGRELRAGVEESTDRLAAPAYDVLGVDGQTRLAELTRPLSRLIVKAGMLDPATIVKRRP
jgi:hypothetical protein